MVHGIADDVMPTGNGDDGHNAFWMPLLLSLMAGMSTCIGATFVFCAQSNRRDGGPGPSHGLLSFSLALAGSVMVTVSIVSILPECLHDETYPDEVYTLLPLRSFLFMQRCLSFGVGCGLYVVLSKIAFPEPEEILGFNEIDSESQQSQLVREAELDISGHCELDAVPSANARTIKKRARIQLTVSGLNSIDDDDNPLSKSLKEGNTTRLSQFSRYTSGADLQSAEARRAWRVAMLLFVSIAVHNFPEGLAVAASSIHSPRLGVTTTVAIALHNIPEGIAIAIPCLAARPDLPWLAFWLATLSGLAEPLGAAVALIALHEVKEVRNDPSYISMNNVLAFVAGIMIMVAILELFPEANRHCQEGRHPLIAGSMLGTIIMLGSDMYLDSR